MKEELNTLMWDLLSKSALKSGRNTLGVMLSWTGSGQPNDQYIDNFLYL
jgi:hypothetical protein